MNAHDTSLRIVPQNIEAEQALLGCLLINNAVHGVVTRILEPQHFHEPLHQMIFAKAGSMLAAGKSVDPITMKGYLPPDVKGLMLDGEPATPMQYLARLVSSAVAPALARDYAVAVHDSWVARQALAVAQEAVDAILDIDPGSDVVDQLSPIEEKIAALRAQRIRTEHRDIGQTYLDNLSAAHKRGQVRGVPICLPEIADVISEPCMEAGNLYGLLSSSGEGKTSLTLQMIKYALQKGHPVLFLSYDQSADQCIRQMVAQEHGIEARRQRTGDLSEKEWERVIAFATWIDRQPFEVVKCTDHGAAQLVGFARTFVKRHGNGKVPLVVVDHIGSVKPEDRRADEGTKAKEINKIFKAGAETTDAAWLILNQRNSYGMKRDNPRPISADLFGGDPAKQAYDAIFYVYRFLKFLEERRAVATSGTDWKKIDAVFPAAVRGGDDIAEIGAVKVRFGNPAIRREVTFEARLTRYASMRRQDQEQAELIEGFR